LHGRWPALRRRAGTDCRTKDKEVVKEALKPHQEEEPYLGVLYVSAPTIKDPKAGPTQRRLTMKRVSGPEESLWAI
jgi:hypothetical protein